MATAIYPGSFDPITLGHLNIIRRAAKIFDRVVVCVTVNSAKTPMFSLEERMELIERVVKRLPNVSVETSDVLLAEYVKQYDKPVLVKGLRAVSDFEYEFQLALINRRLNRELDTVFLPSDAKYTYISSSVVKEMARYGADLSNFVPREILEDVVNRSKLQEEKQDGK